MLVILVVYLFLQDWRATLIPMLAVPVSLVGTFVLFPLFGFSINTLSMFGLVLAIGLVVDDAIVVVEGVQRHIEEGLAPKDAAVKAMEELSAPVDRHRPGSLVGFCADCLHSRHYRRPYQQFALTIAISVILSAFNALTLSPALAALLLRPKKREAADRSVSSLTGSIACSGGPRRAMFVYAVGLFARALLRWCLFAACGMAGVFFGRGSLRAFCPMKTRATFSSTCSFRMQLRWSAQTRRRRTSRRFWPTRRG